MSRLPIWGKNSSNGRSSAEPLCQVDHGFRPRKPVEFLAGKRSVHLKVSSASRQKFQQQHADLRFLSNIGLYQTLDSHARFSRQITNWRYKPPGKRCWRTKPHCGRSAMHHCNHRPTTHSRQSGHSVWRCTQESSVPSRAAPTAPPRRRECIHQKSTKRIRDSACHWYTPKYSWYATLRIVRAR